MIKNIITEEYFRKEYKYNGVIDNDAERVSTETIEFYIGRGSSRVNTILTRAVDKGITAGIYEIPDGQSLKVIEAEFPDAAELTEEKAKVEAIKEATAILTKFGLDTGWDFITGSFSASIGTESFSDTTDFESSVNRVESNVKELLANYDFGNLLLTADSIRIAIDNGNSDDTPPAAWVNGDDRPMTIIQYKTHHAHDHIAGDGIIITGNEQTGESTFSIDPNTITGDLQVDDTEILATETHITDTEAYYG